MIAADEHFISCQPLGGCEPTGLVMTLSMRPATVPSRAAGSLRSRKQLGTPWTAPGFDDRYRHSDDSIDPVRLSSHTMLHPVLEDAIGSLLATWRHYDDLSRRPGSYATRMAARRQLDLHRMRVHRLRRGLHPEARELEEVSLTTHCPSLAAPVFIRRSDLLDADSYACPCGAVVSRSGLSTDPGLGPPRGRSPADG
jgi:hypothetical protein